jgi:DNA-binding beta-propeller fold protein YncE
MPDETLWNFTAFDSFKRSANARLQFFFEVPMNIPLGITITAALLLLTLQSSDNSSVSSGRGTLVVVNQVEHTVLLVEPPLGRRFATIPVGVNGHEAAISPDARFAYVPIYGNSGVGKPGTDGSTIAIIDIGKRSVSGSIDLGKPLRPHRAEFGPGGLLYVTAELGNAIDIIDPATRRVVGEIPTGQPQSHMFVFSPDGRRAYTSNVGAGNISVLDVPGRKLLGVIPVAKVIQRISISPDGRRVFTHDQDSPRLAVIDVADGKNPDSSGAPPTYKVTTWIDLPGVAYASEPTPDGKWLLVASMQKHLLLAIDLATLKIAKSFDLPGAPSEILVRPDGGVAFVSCMDSGKIAVLDLRAWEQKEAIEMTRGVDGLAWLPSK